MAGLVVGSLSVRTIDYDGFFGKSRVQEVEVFVPGIALGLGSVRNGIAIGLIRDYTLYFAQPSSEEETRKPWKCPLLPIYLFSVKRPSSHSPPLIQNKLAILGMGVTQQLETHRFDVGYSSSLVIRGDPQGTDAGWALDGNGRLIGVFGKDGLTSTRSNKP